MPWSRLRRLLQTVRVSELGCGLQRCTACGFGLQLRLARSESGVRCARCGASAVTQSLAEVVQREMPGLADCAVYEMSAQGPLVQFLRRNCAALTVSELLDGVAPGQWQAGVQCQDVQRLTYADASFALCTSTEVFEHVENDAAGFAQVCRVLKPGGRFIFTVPLHDAAQTVERTAERDGQRVHLLPPAYHADRYRGDVILVQRDYGRDLLDRLRSAGFASAEFVQPKARLFGHARPVIVARRAA